MEELVDDHNPGPEAPPMSKRARKEGAKEMSGEKRLLEDRWRRVDMSGSLRERRSEEMTQSNILPHGGRKYLWSPRGGDGN